MYCTETPFSEKMNLQQKCNPYPDTFQTDLVRWFLNPMLFLVQTEFSATATTFFFSPLIFYGLVNISCAD